MPDDDQNDGRISRRKALRRLGAAGALVRTFPAIQTVGMSRALAQPAAGSGPPQGCGNARVLEGGGCGPPNFTSGGCGGHSCLSGANPSGPSEVHFDPERHRIGRRRLGDLLGDRLPVPRGLGGCGRQLLGRNRAADVPG